MASKPILFNTEMVRAILDGRKTMTRRVIKLPEGLAGRPVYDPLGLMYAGGIYRPKYQIGDILWVRETWSPIWVRPRRYLYKASPENVPNNTPIKWHPSIHMPREAARIFLKVTNVRVERLQEITAKDIRSEGLTSMGVHCLDYEIAVKEWELLWDSIYATPKAVKNSDGEILYYESYPWEDIQEVREYKGKLWHVYGNPWVWVYELERVSEDG